MDSQPHRKFSKTKKDLTKKPWKRADITTPSPSKHHSLHIRRGNGTVTCYGIIHRSMKGTCPLEGQCLADSLVYQATISCKENGSKKFRYIGITEGNFKTRYNNHTASFRNRSNMSKTELSKKFWELKDKGKTPQISWEILKTVNKYKCGQEICNLCLTEKLLIIKSRDKYLLNSRSEIISKCRHKRTFLLIKV